jgi:hypothetical protein
MDEKRTLEEFVEDLVTNGRSADQVRAVAICTRWAPQAGEAYDMAAGIWARFKGKARR